MKLNLVAVRGVPSQPETTIHIAGDTITIDGTAHDLSPVPEGGEGRFDAEHPFVGRITRQEGVIHATIRVYLGDSAADDQPTDPAHWVIADAQGDVVIPALRKGVTS